MTGFWRGWRSWGLALLAGAAALAYFLGNTPSSARVETRFLMDTLVTLTVWGAQDDEARRAVSAAFEALEAVDREMAGVPGTPLWDLNQAGHGVLSPRMADVLTASIRWARRTGGTFDPTVAPLLDLWDIPAGPHSPPSADAVASALVRVGWQRVSWDAAGRRVELGGTSLDFGGIAKGYALDRAAEALRGAGVRDFIVDAGGDLFVSGAKGKDRWRVGVQHPRDHDRLLRVVTPQEGAFVTSGDYERFFEWEGRRFHHILDPRSGYPASGCRSVTVWAPTALDADALATALFVLGPELGLALLKDVPQAEALFVDSEGRVVETDGFSRVAPEAAGR